MTKSVVFVSDMSLTSNVTRVVVAVVGVLLAVSGKSFLSLPPIPLRSFPT